MKMIERENRLFLLSKALPWIRVLKNVGRIFFECVLREEKFRRNVVHEIILKNNCLSVFVLIMSQTERWDMREAMNGRKDPAEFVKEGENARKQEDQGSHTRGASRISCVRWNEEG